MTNTTRVQLTPEGLKAMQEELANLRDVERPKVAERIKEAKEGGDISESGEYSDAKDRQAFIEGRVRELERTLARADVIDPSKQQNGVASLGSRVTVDEEGRRDTYRLVSAAEAGRGLGGEIRISDKSAVGKALLGRKVGEQVTVETPGGSSLALTIVSVE